jgi:hypothetical protein
MFIRFVTYTSNHLKTEVKVLSLMKLHFTAHTEPYILMTISRTGLDEKVQNVGLLNLQTS